jgi:hypothetical protein
VFVRPHFSMNASARDEMRAGAGVRGVKIL